MPSACLLPIGCSLSLNRNFSLVCGEVCRGSRQSVALRREPRRHTGLMARRSVRKSGQIFFLCEIRSNIFWPSCLRHSAQENSLALGIGGVSHENGRALSRRRMHQMGGRGVYDRSSRVLSGARANLARYRFSDQWSIGRRDNVTRAGQDTGQDCTICRLTARRRHVRHIRR